MTSELDRINQIFAEKFAHLLPQRQQPRYRYFQDHKQNRYIWTTEPTILDGKKRWESAVYRYYKGKKQWVLKKKVYHARRSKAKERAYRLYAQSRNKAK